MVEDSNHPSYYPDPYEGWTLDPEYYRGMIGKLDLEGDELRKALRNERNPVLRHFVRNAASKNIWLVFPRQILTENSSQPITHEMGDYFRVATDTIEELPSEIIWKGAAGIPLILGKIENPQNKGQANIQEPQKGVRIAITQFFLNGDEIKPAPEKNPRVDSKSLKEVIIHELLHNLSVQRGRDGNFLLPRQDWQDLFEVNGVANIVLLDDKMIEAIIKGWSCIFNAVPVSELANTTGQFLEDIKKRFGHPVLYARDPFEIVAYSATNVDMSDKTLFGYPNEKHNLAASRAILRRNFLRHPQPIDPERQIYYGYEFDGKQWQLYHIQNKGTPQNPIWDDDVDWD